MIHLFGAELGSILQLITTLFSGGILATLLAFYVRNRQVSVNAEATLRTHFGEELRRLTASVHDCEEDKRRMRIEIQALHEEVTGLKRAIASNSADRLAILEAGTCPSDVAPHAVASVDRVRKITKGGSDGD